MEDLSMRSVPGFQSSQSRRSDSAARPSSGSEWTTVTANTSSPRDATAPSASWVSRDSPETGTTTRERSRRGASGMRPRPRASGRASTMSQAPSVNLVAVTTTAATPVSSAPNPLSAAFPCQPDVRCRRHDPDEEVPHCRLHGHRAGWCADGSLCVDVFRLRDGCGQGRSELGEQGLGQGGGAG